jgi:hypothetical protein
MRWVVPFGKVQVRAPACAASCTLKDGGWKGSTMNGLNDLNFMTDFSIYDASLNFNSGIVALFCGQICIKFVIFLNNFL